MRGDHPGASEPAPLSRRGAGPMPTASGDEAGGSEGELIPRSGDASQHHKNLASRAPVLISVVLAKRSVGR